MQKYLLFLMMIVFGICQAQNCTHINLSKNFNFTTSISRINIEGQAMDSCSITVNVQHKIIGRKQVVNFGSGYMFSYDFTDCNDVRSYTTGINKNAAVSDNMYGNLIVADFNFDGKEDFAVKCDSGGNGGPFYKYYLQNVKGAFILDKFLTEVMVFFPTKINEKQKTLVTLVHANSLSLSETTYQYASKTGQWKEIKNRVVSY